MKKLILSLSILAAGVQLSIASSNSPETTKIVKIEQLGSKLQIILSKMETFSNVELNEIPSLNLSKRLQAIEELEGPEMIGVPERLDDFIGDTVMVDTLSKSDTTEIKIGQTRVVIIGKPKIERIYKEENGDSDEDGDDEDGAERINESNKHRNRKNIKNSYFNMDLGFNTMLENNNFNLGSDNAPLLELKNSKSINYSLYFFSSKINLINHHLNFIYKIGLDYNNYRFTNDTLHLVARQGQVTGGADYENGKVVRYTKNKLVSNYLTVPLMLQYQTYTKRGKDGFQLAAGVEMGYLIDSRVKLVSEYGRTTKLDDDFNLNTFRYGLVGRIGYGDWSFYAKYYPSTTFAKGQGPELNTLSFGIALIGF